MGISNRAISKWEIRKCMPDLSLFQPLCEILDIQVNELLAAKRCQTVELSQLQTKVKK